MRRALALDPTWSDAWLSLGALQVRRGLNWEAARAQFAAAERLSPDDAAPQASDAAALEKLGRTTEALAAFAAAEARDPASADIRFNQGNLAARSGDWPAAAAEDEFAEALRLDPSNAEARQDPSAVQRRLHRP